MNTYFQTKIVLEPEHLEEMKERIYGENKSEKTKQFLTTFLSMLNFTNDISITTINLVIPLKKYKEGMLTKFIYDRIYTCFKKDIQVLDEHKKECIKLLGPDIKFNEKMAAPTISKFYFIKNMDRKNKSCSIHGFFIYKDHLPTFRYGDNFIDTHKCITDGLKSFMKLKPTSLNYRYYKIDDKNRNVINHYLEKSLLLAKFIKDDLPIKSFKQTISIPGFTSKELLSLNKEMDKYTRNINYNLFARHTYKLTNEHYNHFYNGKDKFKQWLNKSPYRSLGGSTVGFYDDDEETSAYKTNCNYALNYDKKTLRIFNNVVSHIKDVSKKWEKFRIYDIEFVLTKTEKIIGETKLEFEQRHEKIIMEYKSMFKHFIAHINRSIKNSVKENLGDEEKVFDVEYLWKAENWHGDTWKLRFFFMLPKAVFVNKKSKCLDEDTFIDSVRIAWLKTYSGEDSMNPLVKRFLVESDNNKFSKIITDIVGNFTSLPKIESGTLYGKSRG